MPPSGALPELERDNLGSTTGRPRNFRALIAALSPRVLRGPVGARFVGALGLMLDMLASGARSAVLGRSMLSKEFAPDALPLKGSERGMPRVSGESDATYFHRVYDAWRIWQRAGTGPGLIEAFSWMGWNVSIVSNRDWNWDGHPENWSRIWIVVEPGHGVGDDGLWGDPNPDGSDALWGDGGIWGTNASARVFRDAHMLARDFKPGHYLVSHIILKLDSASVTPDGTWGDPTQRSTHWLYWRG
jgi:hypothetical protein